MDDVSPCNLAAQKKKRRVLTGEQIHVLETTFKSTPNPDAALRTKLSGQVGLPERNVQIWFQNR
ncbi:homeobox domain-containing protein [Fimicolochytrium jonesii]|uniref:homeobox domain-containing protein n=1 Tax=Fimicolochytrium jonesii TaxID=1396493 RepID=UPI0022FE9305|nr:homeobox domain-containing protein [Fimicolochytrium jonesii]KAI8818793.1 homeobox domain-containing protein [Fimicolochytrium jonesii]